jgi:hypothetical protein
MKAPSPAEKERSSPVAGELRAFAGACSGKSRGKIGSRRFASGPAPHWAQLRSTRAVIDTFHDQLIGVTG